MRSVFLTWLCAIVLAASPLTSAQQAGNPDQEARRLLAQPKPAAASSGTDAQQAWQKREQAAIQIGDSEARLEAQQQLLTAARDGEERFKQREKIARTLEKEGKLMQAFLEGDAIVEDPRIGPGRRAQAAAVLAQTMAIANEAERSERYIKRARELAPLATDAEIEVMETVPELAVMRSEAVILSRRGDDVKALAITKQSFELAQRQSQDTRATEARRKAALFSQLDSVWELGSGLEGFGRRDEALALAYSQRKYAALLPETTYKLGVLAKLDYALARTLATYGDYDEALHFVNAALDKYATDQRNPVDNNYALAYKLRAEIYLSIGRPRDMRADVAAFQHARRLNPVLAGNTSEIQAQVLAGLSSREPQEGRVRAREFVAQARQARGTGSSWFKSARALQALAELHPGLDGDAKALAESYIGELATSATQVVDGTKRATIFEAAALERVLDRVIDVPDAGPIAFKAAEILRTDGSQSALLAGAAKMAAANPQLRALVDRERATAVGGAAARSAANQALNRVAAGQKGTNDQEALKRLQSEAEKLSKALEDSERSMADVRREIARRFPRYQELTNPLIPSVADVAKALRQDEVYLNLIAGRNAGYVFLIDNSGSLSAWRVPATRTQTRTMVQRWKHMFDSGEPPQKNSAIEGLDLAAGRWLYTTWLAPAIARYGPGKTFVVSAGGALAPIVWAALPLPDSTGGPGNPRWAIDLADFVTMPSASSLVLTRSVATVKGTRPMFAFADPSFDGKQGAAARPPAGVQANLAATRTATGAANYHKLPRLPETLEEVQLIAEAVGAEQSVIVSGTAATRSRALREDLSQARLVVFATHGIASGEVPGMDSAGLALALEGDGFKDSVLTVEDLANLQINADLVLLSACNTGLASGAVGDTVSALARAFFVAGAKSLMVTGWPVETESAKLLSVGSFRAMAASGTTMPRSLAATQRAMAAGKLGEGYRHPYFWAPYFLVGDGSAQ